MSVSGDTYAEALRGYYRWHAKVYDWTRWSFLFGRGELVRRAISDPPPQRVLEVGCGTGRVLLDLARRLPDAELHGADLSGDMLRRAEQRLAPFRARVHLRESRYEGNWAGQQGYDLVLFSYALTMMNPGWERVLEAARADLKPGGRIAVVDFHDTGNGMYRSWMARNHVRMEGQLLEPLKQRFPEHQLRVHKAYGGLWRWLCFVGRKPYDS